MCPIFKILFEVKPENIHLKMIYKWFLEYRKATLFVKGVAHDMKYKFTNN